MTCLKLHGDRSISCGSDHVLVHLSVYGSTGARVLVKEASEEQRLGFTATRFSSQLDGPDPSPPLSPQQAFGLSNDGI